MDNALMVGLSAQSVLRRRMDAVANNLANLDTTAFKAESLVMRDVAERPARAGERPRGIVFVEDWSLKRDMSEGPLRRTGGRLDVAVRGDGFLAVEGPGGNEVYTRDGRLSFDADALLRTRSGQAVLGAGGAPIAIDPDAGPVAIDTTGIVRQGANELGRLRVVRFPTPAALEKAADGLWLRAAEAPIEVAEPAFAPGFLEDSNVNAVFELSRMIEISRAYQGVSRALEQSGELRRGAIDRLASIDPT